MKKILSLVFIVIILTASIFGQSDNQTCPKIEIIGPTAAIREGDIMTFSVSPKTRIKNEKAIFIWSVNYGKIIKGQGTSEIEVDTNGIDDTVLTATLQISNLPLGCKNSFSEIGVVFTIIDPVLTDTYGKISLKEELERIDLLLIELQNAPDATGFVWIRLDDTESIESAKKRVEQLVKHIKYRGFLKERIVFAIEKTNVLETELIRLPSGLKFPNCGNCEIIKASDIE